MSMTDYEIRQEQEKNDEILRKATQRTLAEQVAELLGNGWEAHHKNDMDSRYWGTELHGPDGAELSFKVYGKHAYQNRGRIAIAGHFPRDKKNGYYGPWNKSFEITVADTRPAADIAKEINRRLLPKYMPELLAAWLRLNSAAAGEAKRDYFFNEFFTKLGPSNWEVSAPSHSPENRYYRSAARPITSLTVKSYASHDSDAQISFDCNRATALQLASVFAAL